MKKKQKQNNRKGLSALLAALIIIAVLIVWLEIRLNQSEPGSVAPARVALPMDVLLRGCLFELGLNENQVEFAGRTVTARPGAKISPNRIRRAFLQLDDVAEVSFADDERVRVTADGQRYEVVFVYKKEVKPVATAAPEVRKRLAIIIDDIGLSMKPVKALAAIDADLTFSVMPMRPYSSESARYLHAKGKEVILHLPMEGHAGANPGAGAIYASMTPAEIRAVLHKDLRAVPYIVGANNHMGSVATGRYEVMTVVMDEFRKKDLFFIDSVTTSGSACRKAAKDAGVACGSRDVFLDNERDCSYIKGQLDKLVAMADKNRRTIGICHPYPETIAVLEKELPELLKQGVRIEKVSGFMRNR